jgi:16S rRNA (uracil1498-N3)-methyltransferase
VLQRFCHREQGSAGMGREEEQDGSELEEPGGKLRLFVETRLAPNALVALSPEQAHYLLRVMRAEEGDVVRLFNGREGEWRARLSQPSRRTVTLTCEAQIAPQTEVPDLWLAFAPIKRIPADYVAQKATELGARVLQPVITHRTNARRVNVERLRTNAVEAAEQSGRVSVPEVRAPVDLPELLASWPIARGLIFCDEGGTAPPIAEALRARRERDAWAVLTGPEGGFDDEERALIRAQPDVIPVTLGPRIMRADTAALAALSVWQALIGDWRGGSL